MKAVGSPVPKLSRTNSGPKISCWTGTGAPLWPLTLAFKTLAQLVVHSFGFCTKRTKTPTQPAFHNFRYCTNNNVDTHGVALPESVESSCFLDDPSGYTPSLRRLLTMQSFFLYQEWQYYVPTSNRSPHKCVHTRFRGSILTLYNIPYPIS